MKKKIITIATLVLGLVVSNIHMVSAYTPVSTGDNTDITPYIILLVVAAVIVIGLFIYKKVKK